MKNMFKKFTLNKISLPLAAIIFACFFYACNEVNNTLAPYVGSPNMSDITVEQGTFKPKLTWLGGYVSVVGVNKGSKAALDSSLVWLIYESGDNIHYPVTFGVTPSGAQDITSQFGGRKADSLEEDNTYTYWVMKENVWTQISSQSNKTLALDSTLQSQTVKITQDTILISSSSYVETTERIDRYINIENATVFGPLANMTVTKPETNNDIIISWQIVEAGVTDSAVAAMGLVEGQDFSQNNTLWEVWSEKDSAGTPLYGTEDIINPPVVLGEQVSGSHVFVEFPASGLQRNKNYYFWIANKGWDKTTHARFADKYSYVTFSTY
jgi:hypothetical protein